MNRQEYRSLLGRIPIETPTPQDMAMLCPHLTADEAVEAFTTDSGYVACPPLRVRHSFQVLWYCKERVEKIKERDVIKGKETHVVIGTKVRPALLVWAYVERIREPSTDGRSCDDERLTCKHIDKAIKFAEDNWGGELILDDWNSFVELYVQDPTDLVNYRYRKDYPCTKAVLRVALTRDLNELLNDESKPESELLDDAISQMTLDHLIGHELRGGRGGFTGFNCVNCGAGLSLSSCTGCGHRFRDDQFRHGGNAPLSRKMVEFLRENGHKFGVDPEIAWTKERESWEAL